MHMNLAPCSMSSNELVPGDVLCIPRGGFIVPCDAVLLSGQCLVDEAMLTGESAPVMKTAVPELDVETFTMRTHSRHVLFQGTRILQARSLQHAQVRSLVVRTGVFA